MTSLTAWAEREFEPYGPRFDAVTTYDPDPPDDEEHLATATPEVDDVAVFPGQFATREVLAREAERASLLRLVDHLWTAGIARDFREPAKVSTETRVAAQSFIRILPNRLELPRIAPDGEGGLTLVWEKEGCFVLAVIDGQQIHLVKNPGGDNAEFFEGVFFDGDHIPDVVLRALDEL